MVASATGKKEAGDNVEGVWSEGDSESEGAREWSMVGLVGAINSANGAITGLSTSSRTGVSLNGAVVANGGDVVASALSPGTEGACTDKRPPVEEMGAEVEPLKLLVEVTGDALAGAEVVTAGAGTDVAEADEQSPPVSTRNALSGSSSASLHFKAPPAIDSLTTSSS